MKSREIKDGVFWFGAIDWNRRLFDSLIPLPDGTSYNAYLINGSDKIALIDTVDPSMEDVFLSQLESIPRVDYIISNHAEQDHSGTIPAVLKKYPNATIICSPKAKNLLIEHLNIPDNRIKTVNDGELLSLGDLTLIFIHTPWVHWPETMVTYLKERKILFTCDFFGSHIAISNLYAGEEAYILYGAKRYYAEIMMPFRNTIKTNIAKIEQLDFEMIAPSHGPIYDKPGFIINNYKEWISDKVSNLVVIPYISMHGSTEKMVDYLVNLLVEREIKVEKFELSSTDIGKLAISLVDAATIVIGTPTVHMGPHPIVFFVTHLANALRPKIRYAAIVGSYGWATKSIERLSELIPNLKLEVLGTVMAKGYPGDGDFKALEELADKIKEKHSAL